MTIRLCSALVKFIEANTKAIHHVAELGPNAHLVMLNIATIELREALENEPLNDNSNLALAIQAQMNKSK